MKYDESRYIYDRDGLLCEGGRVDSGGLLYRLTSWSHADRESIVSGGAPEVCRNFGRFHGPQQRTTYCSTNVLVCFAEVLFHMYRQVLDRVRERAAFEEILSFMEQERVLVAFGVKEISNLIYLDAEGVRADYDSRLGGTMVVHPDAVYEPYGSFSDRLRGERRRGVMYPSARHSEGLCLALFDDETDKVLEEPYVNLLVRLQLIREDLRMGEGPKRCNPLREKLHHTRGYYEFLEPEEFRAADAEGFLYPGGLAVAGVVDFVRLFYGEYPDEAVK